MTVPRLVFADPGEAAGLAAFLGRLLRWEKGAAVRLQAGDGVLGVFARPARFEVLAVLTARLLETAELDTTVSAGELLEGVDEPHESVRVPAAVTGPSWAGLLPPRGGWRQEGELPPGDVREAAAGVVAEFRERTDRLAAEERTRDALDGLAEEIWQRRLHGTDLPLRAVHAAHALGFLRDAAAPVGLYGTGPWLRLRTAYGSVIARTGGGLQGAAGGGLGVTPV
ncbi:hypothetical protein [Streptomyces sp. Z26]|uniref:hypothetical protein n=1 Tax=Streptomyces sp. Z26 TaxID=2500177 RepID=UPI000EF1544A|nr:hypothetical protein [Streptomyces sp. Z26]RLL66824.1 hypothetical protein D7M15_08025 [Streptomyces sp. Z26]